MHPITNLNAVRFPGRPNDKLYDITIAHGSPATIAEVKEHVPQSPSSAQKDHSIDAQGGLCTPSFCHAHVHIDKAFILSHPKYADLKIIKGDFAEAMELTGKAKARFERQDLLDRGRRLIDESLRYGVTSMRVFAEVDEVVELLCLETTLMLKQEYGGKTPRCDIQVCAFAQLPLFTSDAAETRRKLFEKAAGVEGVEALGSTPYVESDAIRANASINYLVGLAKLRVKHLDFHLAYDLDPHSSPHLEDVVTSLRGGTLDGDGVPPRDWTDRSVTLGHCTRLTLESETEWHRYNRLFSDLRVSFVGLPTSDLFMMGRPEVAYGEHPHQRPRGTLQVVHVIERHCVNCAISINNIGNAFTPHGSCNPLRLANMAVGMYQAGTKKGTETIYVSLVV